MDIGDPRILRHLVAAAMLVAGGTWACLILRRLDRAPGRLGWWALILAGLALLFAIHHACSPPWDDESRRLIAIQSLLSDGDFDLADEYRTESWKAFRDEGPSFFTDAARTIRDRVSASPAAFYPRYAVGYSVLLAPFYGAGAILHPVAGRLLATLPGIACSALAFCLLTSALIDRGLEERQARRVATGFALSAPWLFFAIHLWPEPIAGAAALWVVARKHPPKPLAAIALGATAGALPLLHFRYVFLTAPLFLFAAWTWRRRPRLPSWLAAGALLPVLAATLSFLVSCDQFTWEVWSSIDRRAPPGMRLDAFSALRLVEPGLWFERIVWPPAGVVVLVPALLLGWPRAAWTWVLVAAPMVVAILAYSYSSGPLARFWAPLLPLLAAATYPVSERSPLPAILLGLGAAAGIVLGLNPWLCSDAMTLERLAIRLAELVLT